MSGRIALALFLAALCAAMTSPNVSMAKRAPVKVVAKALFRTVGNGVFCGLETTAAHSPLVCWSPQTGYTVTLTPTGGVPAGKLVPSHRGLPRRPAAYRLLRNGKRLVRGAFHCSAAKGNARCRNGSRHGFVIGSSSSFRF